MKRMLAGAAIAAALALGACEGMAPGGYGDVDDPDPVLEARQAEARAAIPQQPAPPGRMSMPNGQPAPGATPQPVIPKQPTMPAANPAPTTGGPSKVSPPSSAPAPAPKPTTGGPSQTPKPPTATAPTPPRPACSSPNVSIRKEISGAVEINCGPPPAPVPAGMSCKAGEQLTWLTRNGSSSYQCMK